MPLSDTFQSYSWKTQRSLHVPGKYQGTTLASCPTRAPPGFPARAVFACWGGRREQGQRSRAENLAERLLPCAAGLRAAKRSALKVGHLITVPRFCFRRPIFVFLR